jgi:hypothetical protein
MELSSSEGQDEETTVLLAAILFLSAGTASAANWKPTPAAISHWKQIALKRQLPSWWKGYLASNTHLTGCKWLSANGIRFYDCRVTTRIDGTAVAFAALVRVSRCGYGYTISSTKGHRTLTRRFTMCP